MELGPNARNLIDLVQHEDDPNDAVRERVLARLNANLATGSAPLTDASSPLAAGSSSGAESIAGKTLFGFKSTVLLAVAVVATGAGLAVHSRDPGPRAASTVAGSSAAPPPRPPERDALPPSGRMPGEPGERQVSNFTTESPAPGSSSHRAPPARPGAEGSSALRTGPAVAVEQGAPIVGNRSERREASPTERSGTREARSANVAQGAGDRDVSLLAGEQVTTGVSSPRSPAARSAPDALMAEARALRDAQQALRAGNSTRALALLAEQERRFANGQLREARAAARAMASCMDAPSAGRARIVAAFETRWSPSPMLSSVRSACGLGRVGARPEE